MYLLSHIEPFQAKIVEEVEEVLGGQEPSYHTLKKLPYLHVSDAWDSGEKTGGGGYGKGAEACQSREEVFDAPSWTCPTMTSYFINCLVVCLLHKLLGSLLTT